MLLGNVIHASKALATQDRQVVIFANQVLIIKKIIMIEWPAQITYILQLVPLVQNSESQSHHVLQQTTPTSSPSETLPTSELLLLLPALVVQEELQLRIPSKTNVSIVYQDSIQLQKAAKHAQVGNSQKMSLVTTVHRVPMPQNGSTIPHGKTQQTTSRRYVTMKS